MRHVFFYPHYSNPYQELLYSSFSSDWHIAAGPIESALQYLVDEENSEVVFHLHWEDALFKNEQDEATARARVESFFESACRFKECGGKLAWTVHNFASHECPYRETELWLRTRLSTLADVAFVHTESGKKAILRKLPSLSKRLLVASHGNYSGCYAGDTTREEARRTLGFSRTDKVFIVFGDIRCHKRVDWTIDALRMCRGNHAAIKLLISGLCFPSSALEPENLRAVENAIYVGGRIPDGQVQSLFAASDYALFATGTNLTSGSMVLALTFGVPVIAFGTPDASDLIENCRNGFLVAEETREALAEAMRRAALLPDDKRKSMSVEAFRTAEHLSWKETAATIGTAFRKLFSPAYRVERAG